MGAKAYFLDNQTYSAEDVNNVFAQLTCGGVSLYQPKESALIDYETAVSNFITPGIDLYNVNSCKVVGTDDGKIKVSQGTCWMTDGSCIIIDADGLEVEGRVADTEQYVYLRRNLGANSIDLIATSVTLTDAVMLAKLKADGTIVDMRSFATAKIGSTSANIYKHDVSTRVYDHYEYIEDRYDYQLVATTFDAGFPGFNYVLSPSYERGADTRKNLTALENGAFVSCGAISYKLSLYVKKDGSKITYAVNANEMNRNTALGLEIWLF